MPQDPNSDSKLTHLNADTDSSLTAIHHTLGAGPTQASPGSHRHDGTDSYQISATDIIGDIPATNGLPPGGDAGQILAKDTATDYDAIWIDNSALYTSQLKHEVKLGEAIAKGQAVYVSSADGTNMIVSKASNASEATSSKTLGLLESGGSTNAKVKVVTEGLLAGLDTSTATAGDPVWLGTSGNLIYGLGSKPVAPAHLVFIGIVTRANGSNGEIFVKPQNGFEFNELHDVLIVSKTNGDLIKYDSASGLWKNAAQSTLVIAPSQVTGTAVITTDSRLSDARTPTAHAATHAFGGGDSINIAQSQVSGLVTALDGKASTTHASTHASGGSDAITVAPSQVTGTAVITTDSRLSDARTPTAHASTHADGGSDEITIAESQVTGLTTALAGKASTTHASTHIATGSDPLFLSQSQITGLVTALAGKASTTHSGTHSDGGSDPVYIEQAQVTGLTTALAGKASTSHASTHAFGGSDSINIAQSQVAGLVTALDGKASSTHVHGNLTNTGTITTSVTATNPVKVVITDSSNAVGTLTTTGASSSSFLRGDGVWGTVSGAIKIASNRTTSTTGTAALPVNTGETFPITFPVGRFSSSPSVTVTTSSPRYVAAATVVTASGFTLSVRNVSDATGTTYLYHWQAIEVIS